MISFLKFNSSLFHKTINKNNFWCCWKLNLSTGNYTVKEVNIPLPKGHYLAGKLWTTTGQNESSISIKKVPIICVHGWLDNAGSFDPLLEILLEKSNDLKVLAVDLPGHGLSSHSAVSHYDTFLDGNLAILRSMKHMEWEKVTLLSHSMGSIISFLFAGTFPEYIDRYIALDAVHPIPMDPVKAVKRVTEKVLTIEKKLENGQTPSYTYEEILKRTFDGRKGTVTLEGCRTLLKRGSIQFINGKYSFTHDLKVTIPNGAGRLSIEQSNSFRSGIACPVCVIKGEPGAEYEPRADFMKGIEHLRKTSKNVEFHLVPGTHHLHLNEPHLVAPIITKFLDL